MLQHPSWCDFILLKFRPMQSGGETEDSMGTEKTNDTAMDKIRWRPKSGQWQGKWVEVDSRATSELVSMEFNDKLV